MTGILAIDTATEACSIALWRDGRVDERHEITPRQHSQRLFGMLRELLPDGRLGDHGVDAIAWGCGPGSFTGLRIAASAVQGLAYTSGLPVIAVSTLACQAQTALRVGLVEEGGLVLSTLDARINEIYHATYSIQNGLPVMQSAPAASSPRLLEGLPATGELVGIGSGCQFSEDFPAAVRERLRDVDKDLVPHARDIMPLALQSLERGEQQSAREVQPLYVRDEISWKKIPQQGKRK